ncbi:MAG: hypothetical protein KDC33_00085 [Thermoleophilia bacterium]|nr:hypothetical protein [Thermoleophilia bacterium]
MSEPERTGGPHGPDELAQERDEIVRAAEAEQREVRARAGAVAGEDPSTRRGVSGTSLRLLLAAAAVGAIVVGVITVFFTGNVGIIFAAAVCGAILAGLLATLLFLQVEDGRVDEDVEEAAEGGARRPPT